ncbi:glycosyltransferase [Candidatus Saccharibacteria bacterium]|nr:glycosyltransferase [Candidatus Saccharibacteria bacterium]
MKVAIVCDWLTNVGGAEKVLLAIHKLYPEAPIYTSQYDPKGIDWFLDADVRTGSLQKYPARLRRLLGAKRQKWFEELDLSGYDLIISVTGAEAKAVKSGKWRAEHGLPSKNPKGIHVSYCHVPTQYYWQMYDDYVKNPGFGALNFLVRGAFRKMVRRLRKLDYAAAQVPEQFITISEYAKGLFSKYYDREASVIHPPVEVDEFRAGYERADSVSRARGRRRPPSLGAAPLLSRRNSDSSLDITDRPLRQEDASRQLPRTTIQAPYYIITSRQVNWKRIDLAIQGCLRLKRRLMVVGEGPEHERLMKLAEGSDLIEFVPLVGKEELAELLSGAKGYIFPSLEPFGIAPVEALAAGCPVIAYGEGGAVDYVVDGANGVLFEKQTVKSVIEGIERFEKLKFDKSKIVRSAEKFSVDRFNREIRKFIDGKVK